MAGYSMLLCFYPNDTVSTDDHEGDENTTIATGSEIGAPPLPKVVYKGCLSMIPLLFKYLFLKARQQCPLIVQLLAVSSNLTTKGKIISLTSIKASRADQRKGAATVKKETTTTALAPGGHSKKDLEAEVNKAIIELNDKISKYEEEYQRNQALYMKEKKMILL